MRTQASSVSFEEEEGTPDPMMGLGYQEGVVSCTGGDAEPRGSQNPHVPFPLPADPVPPRACTHQARLLGCKKRAGVWRAPQRAGNLEREGKCGSLRFLGKGDTRKTPRTLRKACCPHPLKVTCLEPAFGGRTKVPLHREAQPQSPIFPPTLPLHFSQIFFLL